MIESLHNEILDLEVDDSDHSSMYDSCVSSDEYQFWMNNNYISQINSTNNIFENNSNWFYIFNILN